MRDDDDDDDDRDDDDDDRGEPVELGPCCICGGVLRVRNILLLPRKSPTRGAGWGCVVCGLDADGAVAVICDACVEERDDLAAALRWACVGLPAEDGRVPVADLAGYHLHDPTKHAGEMFPDE